MIFPNCDLQELRRDLSERVDSGELTDAESFLQAIAADPDDPNALAYLALDAERHGTFEEAEALAWRLVRAWPASHEGYALLGRLFAGTTRGAAYAALAKEKLHFPLAAETAPADEP